MGAVSQGKRAGARPRGTTGPGLLLHALGITGAVVAWGYLVVAAIDFGGSARGGEGIAWAFLLLAALGAVMCLFLGLLLVVRTARLLGLVRTPPERPEHPRPPDPPGPSGGPPTWTPGPPPPPPTPGGRRAAR